MNDDPTHGATSSTLTAAPPTLPDTDSVWVVRNWYLVQARRRGRPRDKIGISQATERFLDRFTAPVDDPPPRARNVLLNSAIYPYTRDVQIANEGMGYGEAVSDRLGRLQGDAIVIEDRWSRRTKSGRQRIDLSVLEPSPRKVNALQEAYASSRAAHAIAPSTPDPGNPTDGSSA
jgi:hypothetical protein